MLDPFGQFGQFGQFSQLAQCFVLFESDAWNLSAHTPAYARMGLHGPAWACLTFCWMSCTRLVKLIGLGWRLW